MDEKNHKEAFVNFVFTEATRSARKMRKQERKRLAHAPGELKIQFYNPRKINNFSIPTKILQKRLMQGINVHVMRIIDKQLTDIEEKEYELMNKFPYTSAEEDKIKFRKDVFQELSGLYARQARHLDNNVLPCLEEVYRVNTKKIWHSERITQFRYRQKGEASLWAAVYRSRIYYFHFRTKQYSEELGIYGEEETDAVTKKHGQIYYSRDLLKIGLLKAFKDNNVLAEYIQKSEFIGVPGQRLHVRKGMQVTLTVDLAAKDSMTGIRRMVKRGVKLTIAGFRDNNDCIVTKVEQGLHEGEYVEIRRKRAFALCEEIGSALQRLQFPIKRTPDSEIIFTVEDFIVFGGTGIQDDTLRNEMLQEAILASTLGLPPNNPSSPEHEEIIKTNLAVMKSIDYQLRQIEFDEYGMIRQFPFSGDEEDVTAFKKWVNIRMERLYKSQVEEMKQSFENRLQYQNKADVLSIWDNEKIHQYKFRQGGGSEWILRHGQKFYSFRIRNSDGSICRYEDYTADGFKIAIEADVEDEMLEHVWRFNPDQQSPARFQENTYCSQDILRIRLPSRFPDIDVAENLTDNAYLNGMPDQEISLRIGTLVTLLEEGNIDRSCYFRVEPYMESGTKLAVLDMTDDNIMATILSGINTGKVVILTRQPSFAHFKHLGCALLRIQFPIQVDV